MDRKPSHSLCPLAWVLLACLLLGCGADQHTPSVTLNIPREPITHYVDVNEPGASDDNNGLYPTHQGGTDGPWATIRHAASTMSAGDTTCIAPGTYYESSIALANSGSPGIPITLSACGNESVIIDGSEARGRSSGIEITDGYGYIVIEGLTIRNMPRSGITTDGDTDETYQDITIRDCTLHDNGLSGMILAAVDGFEVRNVEAYGNEHYGLDIISSEDGTLSASNGLVQGSSFHHHTGKEGHGLAINQGYDITVRDSLAYHNTIHGFDVSDWPKKGALSHDILFDGNQSYDNGVAGFAINSDSHHVIFRRNVAYGNGADWAGEGSSSGFLCYEGCWHVQWLNNVSLSNTDAGFYVEAELGRYSDPDDSLLVFKNNIAYENGRPEWDKRPALVVEGKQWQVEASHNNWAGEPGSNAPVVGIHIAGGRGETYTPAHINHDEFQTGNISTDPLFVDATLPDVRLQSDSPCIDAGVNVGLSYLGAAPDMGAIEFKPAP